MISPLSSFGIKAHHRPDICACNSTASGLVINSAFVRIYTFLCTMCSGRPILKDHCLTRIHSLILMVCALTRTEAEIYCESDILNYTDRHTPFHSKSTDYARTLRCDSGLQVRREFHIGPNLAHPMSAGPELGVACCLFNQRSEELPDDRHQIRIISHHERWAESSVPHEHWSRTWSSIMEVILLHGSVRKCYYAL